MRCLAAALATLMLAAPALAQNRPANPVPAILPGDGQAGVAAIVDQRFPTGCKIDLALQHRTGRTRDIAFATVEVLLGQNDPGEVHNLVWQLLDEDRLRIASLVTQRPCPQRPRVVVRRLRLCAASELAPLCEPELVSFRPATNRPLPWLEVTYRVER